jgi:RNA polymerase sigma-70 factor (ECF subfamily)
MDDQEVLRLLRKKDQKAIRFLVDRFQPMVLRTARGFVRNDGDARDIAQDVFLKVISHIDHFQGKSSLSTWIYRITINLSLNHIRQNSRTFPSRRIGSQPSDTSDIPAAIPDISQKNPLELMEQRELSGILHQALDSLPERQRIAFTLCEFDDLSYKEIADILQSSLSSVESLIFRARRTLQKKLRKFLI